MAKEKRQRQRKKSNVGGVVTPRRVTKPETVVIGSSSTWNQDELDTFRVTVKSNVAVRGMIPDRFFDFSSLENYDTGAPLVRYD